METALIANARAHGLRAKRLTKKSKNPLETTCDLVADIRGASYAPQMLQGFAETGENSLTICGCAYFFVEKNGIGAIYDSLS